MAYRTAALLGLLWCVGVVSARQPIIDGLTLEQQIAQMFMVTIHGAQLPEAGHDFLQRWQPGAVVLFNSNVGPSEQITRLTNSYQQAITGAGGLPLLIAVDQEGGRVQRLMQGFTTLPVPSLLTAANNPELVMSVGRAVAEELRAVGINMNLAPVADLETNPDNPIIQRRSFGSDPEITGRAIRAYVQGLQDGGVLATLKHFPGHGKTSADSHVELPVLPFNREHLLSVEAVPFQRAMNAEAVMVSHIWYPAIESRSRLPASLSPNIIGGLLRQDLHYNGIVMTDALDMDAVDRQFDYAQAAVMAVKAGADMIAVGPGIGLNPAEVMIQAVIDAVRSGGIPEARIQQSAQRIINAKARYGLLNWQPLDPASTEARMNKPVHEALLNEVFQAGVTIAYDRSDLLPVPPERSVAVVYLATRNYTIPACETYRSGIRWVAATQTPAPQDIALAVDAANRVDTIIVFTDNAAENAQQQALVQALPPEKTVVVALSSPYDWQHFPNIAAYMLTYSPLPQAVPAACAALFGAAPTRGILPVTLSPDLPAGSRAD
jgi:beta-N-acetylhexosaminidase